MMVSHRAKGGFHSTRVDVVDSAAVTAVKPDVVKKSFEGKLRELSVV